MITISVCAGSEVADRSLRGAQRLNDPGAGRLGDCFAPLARTIFNEREGRPRLFLKILGCACGGFFAIVAQIGGLLDLALNVIFDLV